MGFTWVEDVSVGAVVEAVDWNEVKTNTDWLYNYLSKDYPSCTGPGWVRFPVAAEDVVRSADPIELRDRIDWIDDNPCGIHNTGENYNEKSAANPITNPSFQPGCPTACPTANPSANPITNPSYQPGCGSDCPTDCPTANPITNQSFEPGCPSDCLGDCPSANPITNPTFEPGCSTANPTYDGGDNPITHGTYQPGCGSDCPSDCPTANPITNPTFEPGCSSANPTYDGSDNPITHNTYQPGCGSDNPTYDGSDNPITHVTYQPGCTSANPTYDEADNPVTRSSYLPGCGSDCPLEFSTNDGDYTGHDSGEKVGECPTALGTYEADMSGNLATDLDTNYGDNPTNYGIVKHGDRNVVHPFYLLFVQAPVYQLDKSHHCTSEYASVYVWVQRWDWL